MLSSSKKMAPYGSWQSPINAKMVIGGNCKSIWELQHDKSNGGGRLFWVEQTFPTGRRVLFERGAHGKPPVRWSDDKTSVANSVHEYGGGSFCVGNGRVFICHGGGISELDAPLAAPRPIVQNKEGEDVRHADPVFHDKFIYAVQERHEGKAEPKNCVVRLNVETCETEMLVGRFFYCFFSNLNVLSVGRRSRFLCLSKTLTRRPLACMDSME
jgi:hypothetical protein